MEESLSPPASAIPASFAALSGGHVVVIRPDAAAAGAVEVEGEVVGAEGIAVDEQDSSKSEERSATRAEEKNVACAATEASVASLVVADIVAAAVCAAMAHAGAEEGEESSAEARKEDEIGDASASSSALQQQQQQVDDTAGGVSVPLSPPPHPEDAAAVVVVVAVAAQDPAPNNDSAKCWLCLEDSPDCGFADKLCHAMCRDCFEGYVKRCLSQSSLVTCGSCSSPIDDDVVTATLPDESDKQLFGRIKLLRTNPNMRECPQCNKMQEGSEGAPNMTCTDCKTTYCFFHSLQHAGRTCKGTKYNQRDGLSDWLWKQWHTTKCPSCKRRVERDGGCAHMTCLCGFQFCYYCRRDWTQIDYSHFRFLNFKNGGCRAPRFIAVKSAIVIAGAPVAIISAPFVGIGYGIHKLRLKYKNRAKASPSPPPEATEATEAVVDV